MSDDRGSTSPLGAAGESAAPDAQQNGTDRTQELQAHIANAAAARRTLRIVGAGTWLHAGRPINDAERLSLAEHTGVVEYVPGDLTITARAGTTLAELKTITAAHGQWLGLDPAGGTDGTIGATVATASDGPLAVSHGRVRDLVLGVEFITGTGDIARAGGRVVKNVAGFDLVRLHTGAWGTLGVITEVTMRLRARPDVERTVLLRLSRARALDEHVAELHRLPFTPLAAELCNVALVRALVLPVVDVSDTCVLVRLGGNTIAVEAQLEHLRAFGDVAEVNNEVWTRLSALESAENAENAENAVSAGRTESAENAHNASGAPSGEHLAPTPHAVARVSAMLGRAHELWSHVGHALHENFAANEARVRLSIYRGQLRAVLAVESAPNKGLADLTAKLALPSSHVTWEQLPPEVWPLVPSAAVDPISRGLRARLDPAGGLNRGVLGEG